MIIAPSTKKADKPWVRVSAHGTEALAKKALEALRSKGGNMDCLLVPATTTAPAPAEGSEAPAAAAAPKPKAAKKASKPKVEFKDEAATEAAMKKNEKAYNLYQSTGRGKDNAHRAGYSAFKTAYAANLAFRKARGAGRRTKADK